MADTVPQLRSLTDVLTFLRTLEPAARLVLLAVARPSRPVEAPPRDGRSLDGITHASSEVVPGDLFAGLPGARGHRVDYAGAAADAGAMALLSDRASAELPSLVVPRPRQILGSLAHWLRGCTATRRRCWTSTG